jgi:hypothetical protein
VFYGGEIVGQILMPGADDVRHLIAAASQKPSPGLSTVAKRAEEVRSLLFKAEVANVIERLPRCGF